MKITTLNFGEIDYNESDIITFPTGLLGFESFHRFIAIDKDVGSPFMWLQSVEDTKINFATINPYLFYPEYNIQILKEDRLEIGLESAKDIILLTLVVVPTNNPQEISSNLLAPIIINRTIRKAKQIILHNSGYSTKHYLIKDMQNEDKVLSTQVA